MPSDFYPLPTAYLSLGSNLGDRFAYLRRALVALQEHPQIFFTAASALYETAPQDVLDQPWFLNQVVAVETGLTPETLLLFLQQIEQQAGRVRQQNSARGPRTLDLDILLYGSQVLQTATLTVPHPRMLQRRFVLEPLLEIAPGLVYPATNSALSDYLPAVLTQSLRRL